MKQRILKAAGFVALLVVVASVRDTTITVKSKRMRVAK